MSPLVLAAVLSAASFSDQLADARAKYQALEYEQTLPVVKRITEAADVPTAVMVEALALEGAVLAITRDITEAERPFRRLLRLTPAYELPAKTAPKILAAFRKVQAEERALAADSERERRRGLLQRIRLVDGVPTGARGGRPLDFRLRLYDPDGAIAGVQLPYRKAGEAGYSVLALQRDALGQWAGSLPADYTVSSDGFTLQYYWQTLDAKGAPLLEGGSAGAPLSLEVEKGQRPRPLPKGVFGTGVVLTAVAGLTSAALGVSLLQTQAHVQSKQLDGDIDSLELARLAEPGRALGTATTVALAATLTFALASLICFFLTDW